MSDFFSGKRVLLTGGTGSLGRSLLRRLLTGDAGKPARVVVFSRDERKQQELRLKLQNLAAGGEEAAYRDHETLVTFRLGDVRDADAVAAALRGIDIVLHAAALKQVPTCEYEPWQAALTNVVGAHNIVQAIRAHDLPVQTVVGISTDKACHPVNVMGMTKALQERVFIAANLHTAGTRFVCVRYGNVLASRGSVIPLFLQQIEAGGPVTVTAPEMTRFLLSLDQAVDTVWMACRHARPGEVWVPIVPASLVADVARALVGERPIEVRVVGIRPGEKLHESLVSEEEVRRTTQFGSYYVIQPLLPELDGGRGPAVRTHEYSSRDDVLDFEATRAILAENGLLGSDALARVT